MTLQELRFFSIYLSKINPWDVSTRVVRFPLEDFQRIMEFGRLNIQQLMASTDSLLCKVVHIQMKLADSFLLRSSKNAGFPVMTMVGLWKSMHLMMLCR